MKKISVYTDGGSRHNPGPSAIGYVVLDEQSEVMHQDNKYIGEVTNNIAEYTALLEAVKWLCQNNLHLLDDTSIVFYSDSELMVKQIIGSYKIKNSKLKSLAIEIQRWLHQFKAGYQFNLIPREKNSVADKLVNEALDRLSR